MCSGKRPGRNRVLIVDQAAIRVRAGFGRFHRGRTVANDGDLSAVWVHRRNVRTAGNLPGDIAIARTAGGFQGKLVSVDDGIGLVVDGQRLLGPGGNLERNFNLFNVIVAVWLIGNNHLCRVILGTHVLIVDILHLVLSVQQDSHMIRILDRNRRFFPSTVIQVFVL